MPKLRGGGVGWGGCGVGVCGCVWVCACVWCVEVVGKVVEGFEAARRARGRRRRAPRGEAEQEAVVLGELGGRDDRVVGLGRRVHLGQHLLRQQLGHLRGMGGGGG